MRGGYTPTHCRLAPGYTGHTWQHVWAVRRRRLLRWQPGRWRHGQWKPHPLVLVATIATCCCVLSRTDALRATLHRNWWADGARTGARARVFAERARTISRNGTAPQPTAVRDEGSRSLRRSCKPAPEWIWQRDPSWPRFQPGRKALNKGNARQCYSYRHRPAERARDVVAA